MSADNKSVNRRAAISAGVAAVVGLGAGMALGSRAFPSPSVERTVTAFQTVATTATRTATATQTVTVAPTRPAPETLKVVQIPIISGMPPLLVAQEFKLFEAEGVSVQVEPTPGAGPTIEAILTGAADIGFTGHTAVWKLADERGIYLKMVHQGGVTGTNYRGRKIDPEKSTLLLARKGAGISKLADLRGRKLAVNVINDIPYLAASIALRKAGYDPRTFVEWVEIPFPQMLPSLAAGRVDAAVVPPPFSLEALRQGVAEKIADPPVLPSSAIFPPTLGDPMLAGAWWTSEDTLRRKPRAIVAFMRAVANGIRYMYGDEERTIQIVAKGMNLDPAVVKDSLEGWAFSADPDGFTRTEFLEPQMNAYVEIGFLSKRLDLRRFPFTAQEVLR
ncbi:MAG: ABC transporter substrate-binding protein [Candidatus Caldarchaeum sp.]|nr:ABC transporter substrate-binding protein [Candidatus Caldarchaeum sp.]